MELLKQIKKECSKHYPYECDKCRYWVKHEQLSAWHCYISSGLIKPKYYDMFFIENIQGANSEGNYSKS